MAVWLENGDSIDDVSELADELGRRSDLKRPW